MEEKPDKKTITLDDAIRAAFQWDAKRLCTSDRIARIWNGFCDKLAVSGRCEEAEEMRRQFEVRITSNNNEQNSIAQGRSSYDEYT